MIEILGINKKEIKMTQKVSNTFSSMEFPRRTQIIKPNEAFKLNLITFDSTKQK